MSREDDEEGGASANKVDDGGVRLTRSEIAPSPDRARARGLLRVRDGGTNETFRLLDQSVHQRRLRGGEEQT